MAKTLTPEQRERKRQRDAEYRARKAAQKFNGVTQAEAKANREEFNVTVEFIESTPQGLPLAPNTLKSLALMGQLGDYVTAPVTGLQAVVQKTFRGGGRLLTEDGEHIWANQCPHSTDERESKGTVVFWEQVGDGNKDFADGATGFAHRFSRCNKVVL